MQSKSISFNHLFLPKKKVRCRQVRPPSYFQVNSPLVFLFAYSKVPFTTHGGQKVNRDFIIEICEFSQKDIDPLKLHIIFLSFIVYYQGEWSIDPYYHYQNLKAFLVIQTSCKTSVTQIVCATQIFYSIIALQALNNVLRPKIIRNRQAGIRIDLQETVK